MQHGIKLAIWGLGFFFFTACGMDEPLPQNPYTFHQPPHFPAPTYDFDRDPITEAGVKLGKKLFNDPRLSVDGSVACSNCHVQAVAFADPQHRLSVGVGDQTGLRNTPQIANLAFYREFFWDGGVAHLDFVALNAIENPVELGETLSNVVQKLQADADYRRMFREAFKVDSITSSWILKAFAQHSNFLISDRAKYDDVVLGRNDATFTEIEQLGEQLFITHCANCHEAPLFTNQSYANNGLDAEPADEGRAAISGQLADFGKFRIPSLRNVARTAPYMHDGRFEDLYQVLDHYSHGIQSSPTLAPELANGIPLSTTEKEAIIAFLHTLTDWEFMQDERF